MENEISTLYNSVNYYKGSITSKLQLIDNRIVKMVNRNDLSTGITGKYNISRNMVIVLENYIEIMHLCDKLIEKLDERSSELESKFSNSNPFLCDNIQCTECTVDELVETEDSENLSESDTQTIIPGFETQTIVQKPVDCKVEVTEADSLVDLNKVIEQSTEIPKQNSEIEIVIKTEVQKNFTSECVPDLKLPEKLDASSLGKILGRPINDRWLEAQKKYEDKSLKKEFQWRIIKPTKQTPRVKEKKTKKKPVAYTILDDELKTGEHCNISHIVSPFEFYVCTDQPLFASLENSINEDLNNTWTLINKCSSKEETKTLFGNFCFCFLEIKRKWVRVEVIDWMDYDLYNILVQLIDYGEKCYCKYENLHAMNEIYAKLPRLAIKCRLEGIHPQCSDDSNWPQSTIESFIELCEPKSQTRFEVIFSHHDGQSYAVDLLREGDEKTISMILVEKGLAFQEVFSDSNDLDDDFDEEYDNINEAITGYDAQDEVRICQFSDATGKCFKGPGCKLEHAQLSRDGITTDKVLTTTQALVELDLPGVGQYIDVLITGYVSTCHFYAHIITKRSESNLYNDIFEKLREVMNSNNLVQTYEPLKLYPGIGETVLVKDGDEWHRAICLELKDNEKVEVFFVDYGHKRLKKIKNLRVMKEDYLYTPFQAVECVVDGCCEKSDIKKEISFNFFMECMYRQLFKAYVTDSNEPMKLYLWDNKGMGLNSVLKNCGLAQDLY